MTRPSEPHKVIADRWYIGIWWRLRGVNDPDDFLGICCRCGRRGMAHRHWRGCIRFKPVRHNVVFIG